MECGVIYNDSQFILQAAWTIAIVGLGLLLWRSNQKKMILQGG